MPRPLKKNRAYRRRRKHEGDMKKKTSPPAHDLPPVSENQNPYCSHPSSTTTTSSESPSSPTPREVGDTDNTIETMTSTHLQQHQHQQRSVLHAEGERSSRMLRPPPYHAPGPFPRHFLVRPATTKHTASGTITTPGPMVPLIAVDELPEWIDIASVPRELTVEQTMGLQNLGSVLGAPETAAEYYEVRLHQDVRFVESPSSHSANKRRESKNNASSLLMDPDTTSLDPHEMDLLGSSSSKHAPKKQNDLVTAVNGTSGRHGANTNLDDNNSSALNSSSETSYSSSSTEPATSYTRGKKTTTKKGKEKASNTETSASSKGPMGNNATTAKPPVIPLNPRLPTPPPTPIPVNPYPLLRHVRGGEPAPPSHHPASRLLSAIAPPAPGYLYFPAHPQQQTAPNLDNSGVSKPQSSRHQRAIVHCRHWCHHGSCKYGPDCRYEHEMPRTHEKLREVGLADWPNWYKAAIQMAFDMQKKTSRRTSKGARPQVSSSSSSYVDAMTAIMMGGEGGGTRRKESSSHHKARGSNNSLNDVSPSTVPHTNNNEKTVIVEERLGRLANVESGESDGSGISAEHENPEMEVQNPVSKKQDVAKNITAPVENLVDI
ncbi:hypothetical protein PG993_006624 [Apiospora rasikravindrae]|uniref:C3H1-type domain-containing protein n=1 Tax=Apiospora rasikravindrae TaxID=990691 RepID=A0ABR1T673_9PEZI